LEGNALINCRSLLARKFESLGFAIDHKSPGFYGLWFGQIFLPLNKKEYEKDFQCNDVVH
jgi:hypothetical protein